MYVVSGIPISRGIGLDELSYYTIRNLQPGAVVMAPIRGTQRPLLVTKIEQVTNMKSSIRSQSFELQKLGAAAPVDILFPQVLIALERASRETCAHKGALLYTCIPEFVLDTTAQRAPLTTPHSTVSIFEHVPVQASRADRMSLYKNMVRESFARGESVYVLVPTRADVLAVSEDLALGVSQYIIPLHGSLSKKVAQARWADVVSREHPVVIVATATYLSLPRHDLGTIICERESDRAYVRIDRPHVNMRIVAECIARALGVRFVTGDTLLTSDTHRKISEHEIDTPVPLTTKAKGKEGGGRIELVTYTKSDDPQKKEEKKSLLNLSVYAKISEAVARNEHVVLIAPRKGLATTVLCRDCGERAVCDTCGSGYKLHSKKDERILLCHRCGHSESANVVCKKCTSWKLASFGIGDETMLAECKKYLPDISVELLEKKGSNSNKVSSQITIASSSYLNELDTAGLIIFPSLESLLSVPTIDTDIDAARAIARARELAPLTLVHTRTKELDTRMQCIVDGNLAELMRSDLQLRASLKIPPYTREVHIACTGTKPRVIKDARLVIDTLMQFRPKPQPELVRESEAHVSHTTTFSLPREAFPPEGLLERLRALPPNISVTVI
jgi:hypothetical protein